MVFFHNIRFFYSQWLFVFCSSPLFTLIQQYSTGAEIDCMFLLDNNIFASDHGVAFQTGFYKTRAIRFFMDSYGYIFRFKMRLFNIKVLCRPNVYKLDAIHKYVRKLWPAMQGLVQKLYCLAVLAVGPALSGAMTHGVVNPG